MQATYHIVPFNTLYAPSIVYIRHCVFTIEQKIDSNEDLDGEDEKAIHILTKVNNHFVGTARMMSDGHIGRLAVLKNYRQKNIGSNIISNLINEAKHRKLKQVYLGSQCSAIKFYQQLEFEKYDDVFLDAGINHIMMKKVF